MHGQALGFLITFFFVMGALGAGFVLQGLKTRDNKKIRAGFGLGAVAFVVIGLTTLGLYLS